MKHYNIKQLVEVYPFLLPRNVFTDVLDKSYNYEYCRGLAELPNGWHELFLQMCSDLRQELVKCDYLDKFRFTQIKEKFGEMRCYTNGAPESVDTIIDKYTIMSRYVCCVCGKPANYITQGWIEPYCKKHLENRINAYKRVWRIPKKYTEQTYKKGKWHKRTVRYKEEWSRYIKRVENVKV